MNYSLKPNIPYGKHPLQKLDVYMPTKANGAPVIVFFHGGSWKGGHKERYKFVGRALARMGYVAVLPGYRLFPEVKFPGFIEDGANATAWVQNNIRDFGGDSSQIFIGGHSAGAFNAGILATSQTYLQAGGFEPANLRGWIGLSGAYDFYPRPDLRAIFPLNAGTKWKPVDLIKGRQVPALLIHGKLDWIVNISNSRAMTRALKKAGGRVELNEYSLLEHFTTVLPFWRWLMWTTPIPRQVRNFIEANRLK